MPQIDPYLFFDGNCADASLNLDGRYLMASDAMSGERYEGMKNFRVSLVYPKVADAKRVFDALAKGGRVDMPMEKAFWVEAFGMVIDRFGTPWMVSGGEQAKP